jgi:predicted exporter
MLTKLPTLSSSTKAIIWLVQFLLVLTLLLLNQFNSDNLLGKPLKLNADLTSLFDTNVGDNVDSNQVAQANVADQITQAASKSNIVLVGASQLELAIEQADLFAQKLKRLNLVSSVKVNFSQMAQLSDITQDYLPFKQQMLSQEMTELLTEGSNQDLFSHQFSLLNQVANQAVSLTLEQAPNLALADFLSRPMFGRSALALNNEHLVSQYKNKQYVLLSFTTNSDGININSAQQFVSQFEDVVEQQRLAENDVEYLYTGAIFYTSKASSTGKHEMMLYGGISLIATLLLIALVYRNVTAMLATLALIGISFVYGYLALSLFYVEISVIALVFSVTLIGIAADYSFHALTQLKFTTFTSKTDKQPLANIRSSLLMSYLTTGAGYALLLLAPFALFEHIAVFTLFGLFGALVTVLLLYPLFLPLLNSTNPHQNKQPNESKEEAVMPPFTTRLNILQQRFVAVVAQYKIFAVTLFIGVVLSMSLVQFDNDIRRFYQADSQLQTSENKVKAVLKQKWDLQYYLLEAESAQQLLTLEEQLVIKLTPIVNKAQLAGFSAVSQWLPSIAKQQANKRLLSDAVQQGQMTNLQNMLVQADWSISAIFTPLLPEQWFDTDLGKAYKSQWLQRDNKFYSVVRLAGVKNTAILTDIAINIESKYNGLGQVTLIDKAGSISAQLTQFNQHLIWVILAAVFAALVVFISRYGLRVALLAVATPVFSLMLSLLASYYLQTQLTIFNLVAGILVLALGLDYSVFYSEHGLHKKVTLTTVMSALSSVFVFAILVLSSMTAISNFGLTVFIGVLFTFVLAPIVTLANGQSKIKKENINE